MANEITLDGWDKFRDKLNKIPLSIEVKGDAIVFDEANKWAGLAKRTAPVNFGALRGRIQAVKTGQGRAEVVSPIKYSPYREWGTGAKVSVPAELTNYALQFKGAKRTAGSRPTPYFFIHKKTIEASTYARIQQMINKALE